MLQLPAPLLPTTTTNSTSQRAIRLCLAALAIMYTYQAPFRLLDLPPELLGRVCDYLPDEQLKHIRLVCNALQTHSMTAFGQRFFDHLIVILHPTSLAIFSDIAAHKQLWKYVRRVSVSGERIGQSINTKEDTQKHITLQRGLEESGVDSAILLEAFPRLKTSEQCVLTLSSINTTMIRTTTLDCIVGVIICNQYHLKSELEVKTTGTVAYTAWFSVYLNKPVLLKSIWRWHSGQMKKTNLR